MANEDIQYSISVDDSEVLKTLKNIERFTQNVAVAANRNFQKVEKSLDNVGKSAKTSGAKIGAIAGITQQVTQTIINLGRQAVQSIQQVLTESVDLAKTQVTAEAQLESALKSTGNAAGLTAQELKDLASELQSVTNFGDEATIQAEALLLTFTKVGGEVFPRALKSILDVSTAMKVDLRSATLQIGKALNDPIRGMDGLSRAGIQFTQAQKDTIKSLVDTGDVAAAQALILEELEKQFGGSAEAAREADGGIIAFGNAIGDLQEKIGLPILESLGENLEGILSIIGENQEVIDDIATALGELAAAAIDFVGSNLIDILDDIDTDDLQQFADALSDASAAISELAGAETTRDIDSLIDILTILVDSITTIANLINRAKSNTEDFTVALGPLKEALSVILPGSGILNGLSQMVDDFELLNAIVAATTGEEIVDFTRNVAEASKTTKQLADDYADMLTATMGRGGEAPISPIEIDNIIDEELPEDVQKVLDKLADLEEDAAEKRIDIIRKAGQKRLDTEEDFIQKRLDTARDFLRKIDDIERKNAQSIEDSDRDLDRDREDIQRDFSRKQIEIEKDSAKNRIKIEEGFREELRKIQQNFEDSAEEAARNRDAVTFLRLQRERDRAIDEAKITREKRVDEGRTEAQQKREQLQQEREFELEDARIADERRLEDLGIRLERELEAARIANEQELQDLLTSEDRKRQELQTSLDRQLQDARIANERRVEDYRESLDEEVLAAIEAEQKKTKAIQKGAEDRAKIASSTRVSTSQRFSLPDYLVSPGRQRGGSVGAGQSVTVGERGPEIFTPQVAGNVIPLGPSITSPLAASNITSTINNVQNATVNQSMLDPGQQSAMMRAIAANVASETVRRIISG